MECLWKEIDSPFMKRMDKITEVEHMNSILDRYKRNIIIAGKKGRRA